MASNNRSLLCHSNELFRSRQRKAFRGNIREYQKNFKKARANRDLGHTAIVLDYIENLEEQDHTKIRAFFRTLNGLLRSSPILILWPVTDLHDVKTMIGYASAVSSTVFVKGKEILSFSGPPISAYPSIAKTQYQS